MRPRVSAQGAYVLWESAAASETRPELVLIATGSEVAPTLEAARALAQEGTQVAGRLDAVHGAVRSAVGRVPRQRDPA